ncbi:ATP-binding cassette sub-family C member 4-like [Harmonia axyridis]|uniref:ATP-binding cassette sub-family C member 4-like n=1 Tax=Harmonia axyridis TaxID=115357 RepID=UPI001E274DEC|nr:ATP-binding cassette sub-family C member 4-like [Harmonia axyridis]
MEECYPLEKDNPRDQANIISKLFFAWMGKICVESNKQGLELKSIYKCSDHDKSAKLGDRLEKNWSKELERSKLKNKKPSLLRALLKTFLWRYLAWGLLLFLNNVVLRVAVPLILSDFIKLFSRPDHTIEEVATYGGIICAMTLTTAFLNHHSSYGVSRIGMRMRVAVSSLIYRKILRLSQLSLGKTAAGQVVNLLSNDVARFDLVVMALNFIWIGPLQILLVGYLMWREMGISSMVGIVSMIIITLPVQLFMGSVTSKFRMQVAKRTDYRVRIMSEILSGIQVIKMYAWETPFEAVVKEARAREVKYLRRAAYIRSVLVSFMVFVERTTLAVTVICYVLMGHQIRADLVFSLAMYFNLLQLTVAIMFPLIISFGAESLVSIRRLQEFLLMEEKDTFMIRETEDNSIRLKHVDACWVPPTSTLKGISIKLPPGVLCAVIGPVGSGKSSLLKLLLGELIPSSGVVEFSGDISYASQEPWLFASNVRNNILFGEEYNRSHYKTVVRVCALEKDFEQFPEGDKTRVGDRGVSLSGGQRARINLARAVYKDSDIYLLDDPLSAVDTKVGRHLFDKCILEHLRGKTRILVTHQLQYLKRADIIIVLNKGCIEAQGTFDELSRSDLDFTRLLVAADESSDQENLQKLQRISVASVATTVSLTGELATEVLDNENIEEKCTYKGSPFWAYIRSAGNCCTFSVIIFLLLFCQVLLSSSDYWITVWTSQEEFLRSMEYLNQTYKNLQIDPDPYITYIDVRNIFNNESEIMTSWMQDLMDKVVTHVTINGVEHMIWKTEAQMYIYGSLIIAAIVVTIIRSIAYFAACMAASKNLHNKMFHCLLEAPMRFFDTNSAGRVLNRFSKDMGAIDEMLPKALVDVIQIMMVVCGILVMVTLSNPYMCILIVILGIIFFLVRIWYINTARSLKLLEGIAKSPVFSYISSTINGLTTIRATKNENILVRQFDEHQDVHSSSWCLTLACASSYGLWLDLICVIFVCCVVCGFIILDQYTAVQGSFIGLGISQSMILVGMLQFGMRQVAEVVNYLTSVERVLEYTQLEREHPLVTPKDMKPPESWPSKGKIIFHNLILRYAENDPPVINNLSLQIYPTEKIGIVGRTGAGKSSLIGALFRLALIEGKIIIDDIDTKTLGLKDLRKKISIIPQEPVLFSSSMRYNLDPFNEFSDDQLWDVLEEVELKDKIQSLDFMVTEGGSNFSVGQRQLICLARAILRNNKILILDEATANVDPKTDELIQMTIRKKFKRCTVLTIAHRLNTIMDSDKVLVLDSGCKVEFDHPHVLLQDPEGYFTRMLNETGPAMTQTLRALAFDAYQTKMPGIL